MKYRHGAAADSRVSHLAIEVPGEEASSERCGAVFDWEYGF